MLDAEVRHLPVMDHGAAAGMVSVRDTLRALAEEHERELAAHAQERKAVVSDASAAATPPGRARRRAARRA
jgi:signal-transduction protein with cAMP-binding, CBS, and nucleotidyltransferase domain